MKHIYNFDEGRKSIVTDNLLKSYGINQDQQTIEKSEQSSDNNTLEKGGKRAVIGEKREFSGRMYIKTPTGWKFFGKGTGSKAQDHLVNEQNKEAERKAYNKVVKQRHGFEDYDQKQYEKDPKNFSHNVLKNLNRINIRLPKQSVINYGTHEDDRSAEYTRKIKKTAELLSSEHVQEQLKPLNNALNKFSENDIWATINPTTGVHTNDGKHGSLDIKIGIYNGPGQGTSEIDLKCLITPQEVHILNLDDLEQFAKRNNNLKILEKLVQTYKGESSTTKPLSEEVRDQAHSLLNKLPPSNKYVTVQGNDIDHNQQKVTIFINTAREARHPDEYGKEGEQAAKISQQFDLQLNNNVINPLKKLGYSVNVHAK